MTERLDVRALAAELPALLATLPEDAGEVVRVEIDDRGGPDVADVYVETWKSYEPEVQRDSAGVVIMQECGTRLTWRRHWGGQGARLGMVLQQNEQRPRR